MSVIEVQPQRHVRPPRKRANRPEVITSRGRIIGYHEARKGIREISRLLGISRDTVRLWVRRYEEEGHVLTRPRPGRPSHHTSGRSTDLKGSRACNEGNRSSVSPDNYQEANTGDWPTIRDDVEDGSRTPASLSDTADVTGINGNTIHSVIN
ncbi:putative helix-turn-helix HTH_28 domain containing protein 4 [Homarus americanus]|uniref:Putative helix-turn-helix HTH_28 domain containing protein 4 n=1 Tax=Homarus americanus TaxID=6706 RepID=A0A8J5K7L6_HOMAM|nr:putative helix-turn-helix HTH_28 domain containing protein 4 [Homarus americanus]